MKKQNYIVRTLKNRIRRNEEIVKTRKAKKAMLQVAGVIAFMLAVNGLINVAEAYKTETLVVENTPIHLDAGGSQEKVEDTLSTGTDRDGVAVVETIEEKIAKAFPENPEMMIAIAKAESGMNPKAMHTNTNGSIDIGLFQINSVHGHDQLSLIDVDKNIEVAREVYEKQGLTAWSVVNNGAVNKFLD